MIIQFDTTSNQYYAFAKVNGMPFLACSTERNEAIHWCAEMIRERIGDVVEAKAWIH